VTWPSPVTVPIKLPLPFLWHTVLILFVIDVDGYVNHLSKCVPPCRDPFFIPSWQFSSSQYLFNVALYSLTGRKGAIVIQRKDCCRWKYVHIVTVWRSMLKVNFGVHYFSCLSRNVKNNIKLALKRHSNSLNLNYHGL